MTASMATKDVEVVVVAPAGATAAGAAQVIGVISSNIVSIVKGSRELL